MSTPLPQAGAPSSSDSLRRVGVVVHPNRNIEKPLRLLRGWTAEHGVEIVQVVGSYLQRRVATEGQAEETDLIVSIGGDGTTLAALRVGALSGRPVLGVACGSLGALANLVVDDIPRALERFRRGDWRPRVFPALSIERSHGDPLFALNDVAVVRAGGGQVRLAVYLDGALFARIAGDGAVVSTPVGTSGYAISAGGPLLAPGVDAFALTPLPKHGGFAPPLVIGPTSELVLEVVASFGGARLEVDGQVADAAAASLAIGFRPAVASQVSFDDQEPLLAGLRRRRILLDSPRIRAEADRRDVNRRSET